MATVPTLQDLRRYAIARTLFKPTTLPAAIQRLGFVQADPIRAPARAQDLTLRHRVDQYRAGDLAQRYPRLKIDEDCFVNYGFLPSQHLALMHPCQAKTVWDADTQRKASDVLAFIRERGAAHPREVEQHFAHGSVRNYWGGSSRAGTQLLIDMHYRGLLRVQRRDRGVRVYQAATHPAADDSPAGDAQRAATLIDLIVHQYAPLPAASLTYLIRLLLGYGAPHLTAQIQAALPSVRARLNQSRIDGTHWYWPANERPRAHRDVIADRVRLLAPFDPVVWDRRRFTCFWGWAYKFEAYTSPARRQFGYYALPMLWRDQVIGWANLSTAEGRLVPKLGYVSGTPPADPTFRRALDDELDCMQQFLTPRPDAAAG